MQMNNNGQGLFMISRGKINCLIACGAFSESVSYLVAL